MSIKYSHKILYQTYCWETTWREWGPYLSTCSWHHPCWGSLAPTLPQASDQAHLCQSSPAPAGSSSCWIHTGPSLRAPPKKASCPRTCQTWEVLVGPNLEMIGLVITWSLIRVLMICSYARTFCNPSHFVSPSCFSQYSFTALMRALSKAASISANI